jgi:hypothetical protein
MVSFASSKSMKYSEPRKRWLGVFQTPLESVSERSRETNSPTATAP